MLKANMKTFLIVLCLSSFSSAVKLPEEVKKCSKSDPNLKECLKDAVLAAFNKFASGYKPLGIGTLEPMTISELTTEGSGGITQVYRNIKIDGISKCHIDNVDLNINKLTLDMKAVCPHTEMNADYVLKGKLLTFPIDSSGKCNILLDGIDVNHKTKLERFEKDGRKYLRIRDWKMKLTPSKVHFYYENIMPGNKQLSDTIMKTMNENGVQIFLEQAIGFEEGYAAVHKAITNKVFEKIPEDELFLP
ncbi:hypothetical protein WA026_021920 [Henosepilachna vigintioctopunctata]|uniref:Uncharacterized protein n=1 Tax=Henosepilachna vigintioctopunctata TaxID=420089 RepID=A0AAW1VBH4_9CUCU